MLVSGPAMSGLGVWPSSWKVLSTYTEWDVKGIKLKPLAEGISALQAFTQAGRFANDGVRNQSLSLNKNAGKQKRVKNTTTLLKYTVCRQAWKR